jgi:outer membrane protein OmpA-like peptidoglycan-associated protein
MINQKNNNYMKKNILLSLLILLSIQVMSQEKGVYLSLWGGAGPTGLKYKMEGVDFADPKCDLLLGGQAGLGFSYYFTKHVGITIGAGVSHYRTKAILEGNFQKGEFFSLGTYTDNDSENHIRDYELKLRTQNWTEYQSVKFLEVPLMINFQKKFGEKEVFGLYLSLGAKLQLPIIGADYAVVDGKKAGDNKLMISGDYHNGDPEFGGFNFDGTLAPDYSAHGFGQIHNPSDVLTDAKGKLDLKLSIAAVGEAGILISLSRRVDIALGAFIDYGFMDMNKRGDTKALFSYTGNDYVSGAEYNVGNGIDYNSLLNSHYETDKRYVEKINTFSYGGKFGLRVKLGKLSQKQQPQVIFAPCDKDTVYIYKFESQPLDVDSLLKEIKDALNEMPKWKSAIDQGMDDDGMYGDFPKNIAQKDIDFLFGPIYFDLDKATLRPESIEDLDKKVEILKRYPEMTLVIYGNTCDLGTDPHNYKLGQRRAEAARNYLISKGIAPERLESSTLSRFQPELPNTDEPNRQHNRRDDFKPVYKKR